MKLRAVKDFRFSPNGTDIRELKEGDEFSTDEARAQNLLNSGLAEEVGGSGKKKDDRSVETTSTTDPVDVTPLADEREDEKKRGKNKGSAPENKQG